MKLTDLTPDELAALFAFSVPAPLADLGMGAEAKTALRKLATSLPPSRQPVERNLRSRLYLDSSPWRASQRTIPTLSTLREAVWEDRWVCATLLRMRNVPIDHVMAPYALVAKGRTWYVVWRGRDERLRVDLASHIIAAEKTRETFVRPQQFDVEDFWTTWAAAHEAGRWLFPVSARVRRDVHADIERDLGGQIRNKKSSCEPGEWIQIELAFDHFEHARATLLGYGGAVEVLQPKALRRSIADFAQSIVDRYSTGPD